MAPTIYFGVELEFCLGLILPGMANPHPASPRMIEFPVSEDLISEVLETTFTRSIHGHESEPGTPLTRDSLLFPSSNDPSIKGQYTLNEVRGSLVLPAMREHIGQELAKEGLPFSLEPDSLGATDKWAIGTDTSVGTIEKCDQRYLWYAAEITSPAYPFTAASLKAVKKVCDILSTKYLTKVNNSCGLHVHVSFGLSPEKDVERNRWTFWGLKKLMMFIWAFEPQFDTLHPSSRRRPSFVVRSMRSESKLVSDLQREGVLPDLLLREGLERINATKDSLELARLVSGKGNERSSAVSMYHITQFLRSGTLPNENAKIKPTVEFRQHEGTLDGERVVRWIETVVGVVKWLEESEVSPESLTKLVNEFHESWKEKRGRAPGDVADEVDEDGHGSQHEFVGEKGEGYFTIIELLELIGLSEQAEFYRTRLYRTILP